MGFRGGFEKPVRSIFSRRLTPEEEKRELEKVQRDEREAAQREQTENEVMDARSRRMYPKRPGGY
jgi:hypothetical protein